MSINNRVLCELEPEYWNDWLTKYFDFHEDFIMRSRHFR